MENTEIVKNEKKPGKVGAFFYGLLVMFIYLVIVSVVQIFGLIPIVMSAITDVAGDMTKFQDAYLQKVGENSEMISTLTFVGTLIAVIVMTLWYFFGVYKKSVKEGKYESVLPKLKSAKSIAFLFCGAIAGYSVAVLILLLTGIIMPSITEAFETTINAVIEGSTILGYILSLVLAPIGEELCLRGLVMARARKSYGFAACVVLSGIFFGIYHLNPIQGLYAIPIGMFLGYVAYKYNSVIPCMFVHFLNNLLAGFSGVLGFGNWIVPTICAIVFGILMIILAKKLNENEDKDSVNTVPAEAENQE